MKNILFVGAHFDDTELGGGALIAKFINEGKRVFKITLTKTDVFDKRMGLNISAERAAINSAASCKITGAEEIPVHSAPYGELVYTKQIMQEIENIIVSNDIDTCFFHFNSDYNTDHIAAHQICKTAARHCKNLLMYQSNPYIIDDAFYPNVFFDVSDFIEIKRKALSCYDKEHDRQNSLFETSIERNKLWGYGIHSNYAEAFVAIKLSL